jgi:hypothetical protein
MATLHIAPLDDVTKRRLLSAVAQRGKASGLKAAAKLLTALCEGRMRVVGTNDIKDLAAAITEKAAEIRSEADAEIAALERQSKT